jgi:hypothetical protein
MKENSLTGRKKQKQRREEKNEIQIDNRFCPLLAKMESKI